MKNFYSAHKITIWATAIGVVMALLMLVGPSCSLLESKVPAPAWVPPEPPATQPSDPITPAPADWPKPGATVNRDTYELLFGRISANIATAAKTLAARQAQDRSKSNAAFLQVQSDYQARTAANAKWLADRQASLNLDDQALATIRGQQAQGIADASDAAASAHESGIAALDRKDAQTQAIVSAGLTLAQGAITGGTGGLGGLAMPAITAVLGAFGVGATINSASRSAAANKAQAQLAATQQAAHSIVQSLDQVSKDNPNFGASFALVKPQLTQLQSDDAIALVQQGKAAALLASAPAPATSNLAALQPGAAA